MLVSEPAEVLGKGSTSLSGHKCNSDGSGTIILDGSDSEWVEEALEQERAGTGARSGRNGKVNVRSWARLKGSEMATWDGSSYLDEVRAGDGLQGGTGGDSRKATSGKVDEIRHRAGDNIGPGGGRVIEYEGRYGEGREDMSEEEEAVGRAAEGGVGGGHHHGEQQVSNDAGEDDGREKTTAHDPDLDEVVEVEYGVERKESVDDLSQRAMVRVEGLMRRAESPRYGVERLERKEVLEGELGDGDHAEALREVDVI